MYFFGLPLNHTSNVRRKKVILQFLLIFIRTGSFSPNTFLKYRFVVISGNSTLNIDPSAVQIPRKAPALLGLFVKTPELIGQLGRKTASLGRLFHQIMLEVLALGILHGFGKTFLRIIVLFQ